MQLDVFNAFRGTASDNGVLFYYTGDFSQHIVAAIGDTLKSRLETVGANQSARRKVFSTFVEMAQNIIHYADGEDSGNPTCEGALAVGTRDRHFFVVCGNPVRLEHVARLREKLEPLRRMTLDEIKSAYREQLRNEAHAEDSISRGAGLGFLTVARDASEPIDYSIVFRSGDANANEGCAEFYLKAVI